MAPRSLILAVACALVLGACGSSSPKSASGATSTGSTTTPSTTTSSGTEMGFEGVPIEQGPQLAPASTTGTGVVDGIHCAPIEQLAYHIHAHLAVYYNGVLHSLPGGVGIPGSMVEQTTEGPVAVGGQCYYWLHTHAPDGIIHIESPTARVYTLGQFFDEWHQPLSDSQVASVTGHVTAFVNGSEWKKSPRDIPLIPHAVIQLNVGQPAVPFHNMSWAGLQL